jgi:hypothetical protein
MASTKQPQPAAIRMTSSIWVFLQWAETASVHSMPQTLRKSGTA